MTPKPFKFISIAGPDCTVSPSDLQYLAKKYPFVEWSVLYFPGGDGKPRYPMPVWREVFFDLTMPNTAAHLCGIKACRELLAGKTPSELYLAKRWQINANVRSFVDSNELLDVYHAALEAGPQVILQYHSGTAEAIGRLVPMLTKDQAAKVQILLDTSGGRGIACDTWTIPDELKRFPVGLAGGLNHKNIASSIQKASLMGVDYWMDLESGVRTDNVFDLELCEKVLAAAETQLTHLKETTCTTHS